MRYAICNETFEGWDHARVCDGIAELGYTGLEIAPFTLAAADHRRVRRPPADTAPAGRGRAACQIIGLHWLLAKTEGLQLTSPDAAVRQRTGGLPRRPGPRCRRPGRRPDGVRVAGQRKRPRRAQRGQADGLRPRHVPPGGLPASPSRGASLCLEPLTPPEADFLNDRRRGASS